jgi:hypothetical protein
MKKKKEESPQDENQTLKESAKEAFERAEVRDHTKKVLQGLTTKKQSKEENPDLFLKKVKEEVKKNLG